MTEEWAATAMNPSGIAGAVRIGAEAIALDMVGTGSCDIALGTLSIRIPHNATTAEMARAIRLAIAGRLR